MKIHYLTWLRNRLGKPQETIDLPANTSDLPGLITYLSSQGDNYAAVFSDMTHIKISINGQVIEYDAPVTIHNDDTVSFFSPMAGG